MKKVEMTINGEAIKVDVDDVLEISDLDSDMSTVAAQMGYWASLNASAERERVQADSFYRQWRAESGKRLIEKDPKLAEWKVRQEIEAADAFKKLKNALAEAVRNTTITRGIYEALRTKASMLQSRGAMMRAELDATGMKTLSDTPTKPKKSMSELNDGVRKALKKKKKIK